MTTIINNITKAIEIIEFTDAMRFAEARRLRIENGTSPDEESKYDALVEQLLQSGANVRSGGRNLLALQAETLQRCAFKNSNLDLITTIFMSEEENKVTVVDSSNSKLSATIACTTPLQKKAFDLLIKLEAMDGSERLAMPERDALLRLELHEIVLNRILDSSILGAPVETYLDDDMFTAGK